MRTPFDQVGKRIGRAALRCSGPTEVQFEIAPEVQHADLRHVPSAARHAARASLGLLGRIASGPCLIEVYARAPTSAEFRACLSKHLAHWQRHARAARASGQQPRVAARAAPSLWIIAAGTPTSLVQALPVAPASGWPDGVYLFGDGALRVGLIAANRLPRERSTLLVRLMAAGPLLAGAIAELSALPAGAHERAVSGQILLGLKHALGQKEPRTPEEEEVLVAMQDFWETARAEGREQGRKQGRKQGRMQGRVEARANDVLTVLRARGVAVPEVARARILAERDPERLERWLERASVAASIAAVLDEPRRAAPRSAAPRPAAPRPAAPSRTAGRATRRPRQASVK